MSTEFTYLKQILELVEREGNEHQKRKLWSLVARYAQEQVGTHSENESVKLIAEVHELNLEQYIKVQAAKFYESFPLSDIKAELISDFIAMEHSRRRDDFEGFALAVFQQLENITNYLFIKDNLWLRAKDSSKVPMFTTVYKDGSVKKYGKSLGAQIIYAKEADIENKINQYFTKNPNDADFMAKFKMVLYFGYFNEIVKSFDEWSEVFGLGYDIYLSRNRNHRGAINTEAQAKKQELISKSKYNYYLLFLGYLADFIQKLTITYTKR